MLPPDLIVEIDLRLSQVDTNRTAEYIRSTVDRLREANESENQDSTSILGRTGLPKKVDSGH